MRFYPRKAPRKKADILIERIASGKCDDLIVSELKVAIDEITEADEVQRISWAVLDIALNSENYNAVSFAIKSIMIFLPMSQEIEAALERRMLTLFEDKSAFGNKSLQAAMAEYLNVKTSESLDMAQPFMPCLLQMLEERQGTSGTTAYAMLMDLATDRPDFYEPYSGAMIRLLGSINNTTRIQTARLISVLGTLTPEYNAEAEKALLHLSSFYPDNDVKTAASEAYQILVRNHAEAALAEAENGEHIDDADNIVSPAFADLKRKAVEIEKPSMAPEPREKAFGSLAANIGKKTDMRFVRDPREAMNVKAKRSASGDNESEVMDKIIDDFSEIAAAITMNVSPRHEAAAEPEIPAPEQPVMVVPKPTEPEIVQPPVPPGELEPEKPIQPPAIKPPESVPAAAAPADMAATPTPETSMAKEPERPAIKQVEPAAISQPEPGTVSHLEPDIFLRLVTAPALMPEPVVQPEPEQTFVAPPEPAMTIRAAASPVEPAAAEPLHPAHATAAAHHAVRSPDNVKVMEPDLIESKKHHPAKAKPAEQVKPVTAEQVKPRQPEMIKARQLEPMKPADMEQIKAMHVEAAKATPPEPETPELKSYLAQVPSQPSWMGDEADALAVEEMMTSEEAELKEMVEKVKKDFSITAEGLLDAIGMSHLHMGKPGEDFTREPRNGPKPQQRSSMAGRRSGGPSSGRSDGDAAVMFTKGEGVTFGQDGRSGKFDDSADSGSSMEDDDEAMTGKSPVAPAGLRMSTVKFKTLDQSKKQAPSMVSIKPHIKPLNRTPRDVSKSSQPRSPQPGAEAKPQSAATAKVDPAVDTMASNAGAEQTCPNCGSKLTGAVQDCGKCGFDLKSQKIRCAKCGQINSRESNSCVRCGARIVKPAVKDPSTP